MSEQAEKAAASLPPERRQCLIEPGLWAEVIAPMPAQNARRGALFLDRDGVLNRDDGYVGKAVEKLEIWTEIAPLIRAANNCNAHTVIVTNQSGVARGYYDWAAFDRVMDAIKDAFKAKGCRFDGVFACGYYGHGRGALAVAGHPWRKPNPGMLIEAASRLPIDLSRSMIVGDKISDMQAGANAGLKSGVLIECGEASSTDLDGFHVAKHALKQAEWARIGDFFL